MLGTHWITRHPDFLKNLSNIEERIINLIHEDRKTAVSLIYDAYAKALYGVLLKMMDGPTDAQDVLQESFIKIYRSIESYDPDKARLFTWLMRVARNTAIDHIRQKKGPGGSIKDDIMDYQWAERPNRVDTLDLKDHVAGLGPKYQSVVELFYFKGFTHKEASEALMLPLGTIKSRLRKALLELKKIYKPEAMGMMMWIAMNL